MQSLRWSVWVRWSKVYDFGRSEPVAEGQEHHKRIAMAVTVLLDGLDQLLDLVGGQVFAGAQLRVRCTPRGACSIFSGWRDQSQIRFCRSPCAFLDGDCSNNRHYLNRRWI
jgi:hypothetical protein